MFHRKLEAESNQIIDREINKVKKYYYQVPILSLNR